MEGTYRFLQISVLQVSDPHHTSVQWLQHFPKRHLGRLGRARLGMAVPAAPVATCRGDGSPGFGDSPFSAASNKLGALGAKMCAFGGSLNEFLYDMTARF